MSRRRLPPLNALRAFEAAARHMNFTRAAEELSVTPGAISQQIKLLEEHVGATLFQRAGRGLTVSEAGRAALPAIRDGFDRLAEGAALMRKPVRRGRLAVSSAPSFAAKWLAPRLADFHALRPDVEIWVSADTALVDFDADDVDIAVRYGAGGYPGLVSERLLSETVLPVCAPGLPSGDPPLVRPGDLAGHALLHDGSPEVDPSCPDWDAWLKARGVKGVDAQRGPRFNQSSLVIEAAVAGRGVALAKRSLAQADLEAGRLVAPFADGSTPLDFSYYVVHPSNRPLTAAGEAFIDWLRRAARDYDLTLGEL
ncbi:MAG: transcriptional regulator GcvA [Maricaulaceae bacterium]